MRSPADHFTAGSNNPAPAASIYITEGYVAMLKTDLILRNPVQYLGGPSEDVLAAGQFGGVLARAGVGKTALMVQMALNSMLHGRNVLHVSLNQPVNDQPLVPRNLRAVAGTRTCRSPSRSGSRCCRTASS